MALWELYRRGFDTHHIFSVDEYYWENRRKYYQALADVPKKHAGDLTHWLEYSAEGLKLSLERAWMRIQTIGVNSRSKILIKPKQEKILLLLRDQGAMAPKEIWQALGVSRQGAMDTINPLLEAGIIERVGSRKTGQYRLVRTVVPEGGFEPPTKGL